MTGKKKIITVDRISKFISLLQTLVVGLSIYLLWPQRTSHNSIESQKIERELKIETEKLTKNDRFMALFKTLVSVQLKSSRFIQDFDLKSRLLIEKICKRTVFTPNELISLLASKELSKIDWKKFGDENPKKENDLRALYSLREKILSLSPDMIQKYRLANQKIQENIEEGKYGRILQRNFEKFKTIRKEYFKHTKDLLRPLLLKKDGIKKENKERYVKFKAQRDKLAHIKKRKYRQIRPNFRG